MSASNRKRAARECSRATGVPLHTCLRWAEDGRIGRHQPVPDAHHPDQRRFEAMILLRMAELLRRIRRGSRSPTMSAAASA
ncbi:hypothetical protein, partial [Nocardia sp. NPDC004722]